MTRFTVPLLAAGLMVFGTSLAKDTPKTNVDIEAQMAAEMRERAKDPNSEDARELERVRRAGLPQSQ